MDKQLKDTLVKVGLTVGGVLVGTALLKRTDNKAVPVLALAGGIYATAKMKDPMVKSLGTGLAVVGGIGLMDKFTAPKEGETVTGAKAMLRSALPSLAGVDGMGNPYLMNQSQPEIIQDAQGNMYMVNGLGQLVSVEEEPELITDAEGNVYAINGMGELERVDGGSTDDELKSLTGGSLAGEDAAMAKLV